MTKSSYEQALKTLEKAFEDRIRRPSGETETKSGALASIRPSILPGGSPSLSREFTSVAELSQKLDQVEDSATSVALQGTIARSGEILLLTIGDVVSYRLDAEKDPFR
jgi:hypothetical protein